MATLDPNNSIKFVNPYNFISKTPNVERSIPESKKEGVTGYISCSLKVKDELLLPDKNVKLEGENNKLDFYKINGVPVIPGSELRGCIRSIYEAITPCCFAVINTEILHKRIDRPDTGILPGILSYKNGKYQIEKAEKVHREDGYDIERKWMNFIERRVKSLYFKKVSNSDAIICDDAQIAKLKYILSVYRENVKDSDFKKIIIDTEKKIKNRQEIVVFYKREGEVFEYLSVAQISRNVFNNTVPKMLGEHNKCDGKNGYCPACSLFGTIGEANPISSKVRFTDAVARERDIIGQMKIIPELSSPKITSVEFYSENNNSSKRWTYDDPGVELRGRKYYFHSKPKVAEELNKRNIATKPAKAGSMFDFKVYFNNISQKQLKEILWVLTLGENKEDSKLMQKIGYGKPVGYGSIKITVDNVVLRECSEGYKVESKEFDSFGISDQLFEETQAFKDLKHICDYDYVQNMTVSYPIADDGRNKKNSRAPHLWFASNRTQDGNFRYSLPKLSDEKGKLELPAMTSDGQTSAKPASTGGGYTGNYRKPAPAAPARPQAPEGIDKIQCPVCEANNYKFNKYGAENPNWTKGYCHRCGAKLFE